jgi:hypothetical protein
VLLLVLDSALAEELEERIVEEGFGERSGGGLHLQRGAVTTAEEVGEVGGG